MDFFEEKIKEHCGEFEEHSGRHQNAELAVTRHQKLTEDYRQNQDAQSKTPASDSQKKLDLKRKEVGKVLWLCCVLSQRGAPTALNRYESHLQCLTTVLAIDPKLHN